MSDTNNVLPLTAVQETDGDVDLYCVIHPFVDSQSVRRSWKRTQAAAAKHAKQLLAGNAARAAAGKPSARKLYVVKVVEVLELPGPKIDSRRPNVDDVEEEPNAGG